MHPYFFSLQEESSLSQGHKQQQQQQQQPQQPCHAQRVVHAVAASTPPARLTPQQLAARCENPGCKRNIPQGGAGRCARCKCVSYCTSLCQKNDWNRHRATCRSLAAAGLGTDKLARLASQQSYQSVLDFSTATPFREQEQRRICNKAICHAIRGVIYSVFSKVTIGGSQDTTSAHSDVDLVLADMLVTLANHSLTDQEVLVYFSYSGKGLEVIREMQGHLRDACLTFACDRELMGRFLRLSDMGAAKWITPEIHTLLHTKCARFVVSSCMQGDMGAACWLAFRV